MNNIREILNRDGFAEAEKITGRSYKEDKFTETLGIANFFDAAQEKNKIMLETGDSIYSDDIDRYMKIISEIGFEQVLKVPFEGNFGEISNENLFIYWRAGILLVFDTFQGKINGGSFYYNWKQTVKDAPRLISSGFYKDGILVGYHDCREAIKFHIGEFEKYGEFLVDWVESSSLWLLHWGDIKRDYDYKKINAERISQLPENVRSSICCTGI